MPERARPASWLSWVFAVLAGLAAFRFFGTAAVFLLFVSGGRAAPLLLAPFFLAALAAYGGYRFGRFLENREAARRAAAAAGGPAPGGLRREVPLWVGLAVIAVAGALYVMELRAGVEKMRAARITDAERQPAPRTAVAKLDVVHRRDGDGWDVSVTPAFPGRYDLRLRIVARANAVKSPEARRVLVRTLEVSPGGSQAVFLPGPLIEGMLKEYASLPESPGPPALTITADLREAGPADAIQARPPDEGWGPSQLSWVSEREARP